MNEIKQTIKCEALVEKTGWLPSAGSHYEQTIVEEICAENMTRIVGGNFYNAEGYFCQIFQCPRCHVVRVLQGEYGKKSVSKRKK